MSETREFKVVWEGRVQEVYYVEAESEEEARRIWSDYEPDSSESLDGGIESVEDVTDA